LLRGSQHVLHSLGINIVRIPVGGQTIDSFILRARETNPRCTHPNHDVDHLQHFVPSSLTAVAGLQPRVRSSASRLLGVDRSITIWKGTSAHDIPSSPRTSGRLRGGANLVGLPPTAPTIWSAASSLIRLPSRFGSPVALVSSARLEKPTSSPPYFSSLSLTHLSFPFEAFTTLRSTTWTAGSDTVATSV